MPRASQLGLHPGRVLPAAAAIVVLGCGSWFGQASALEPGPSGRFFDPVHGFSVAAPGGDVDAGAAAPPTWQPVHVRGAVVAYRDRSGASLSMLRECGRGDAPVSVLARQLRIGLQGSAEPALEAFSVSLRGDPGWQQLFRTVEGSEAVLVRTVTLRSGGCTYDWVLVGAGDPARDAAFDRWWRSFERPSAGDAGASS